MSSDVIYLNNSTPLWLPCHESSVPGYIKHVHCEGAYFHVVSYSYEGKQCSHKNCIINHRKNKEKLPDPDEGSYSSVKVRCDDEHCELPNPERLPGGTTNADINQQPPSAAPVDRVVGQVHPITKEYNHGI